MQTHSKLHGLKFPHIKYITYRIPQQVLDMISSNSQAFLISEELKRWYTINFLQHFSWNLFPVAVSTVRILCVTLYCTHKQNCTLHCVSHMSHKKIQLC